LSGGYGTILGTLIGALRESTWYDLQLFGPINGVQTYYQK
jgi:predicted ABC-type sugar transport system permease subunit